MTSIFERSSGAINVSGNDALDFFNRMSTNDLSNFPDGKYKKTVFTNDKGRIIDLVTLLKKGDGITMLTSPGYEERIIQHLDKYIIMDDVVLEKVDNQNCLYVFGSECIDRVNEVLGTDIKNDNAVHSLNDGVSVFFDGFGFDKVVISGPSENISEFALKFPDAMTVSNDDYNLLRIEHGIAEAENEINDNINPVEIGFNEYISYTKGCYIGQEVIARLDSQGKIPKQLVKIFSESSLAENDKIFTDDDKETGFISSAAEDNGSFKALGFIRSVNLDYEKEYIAKTENGDTKIKISKAI